MEEVGDDEGAEALIEKARDSSPTASGRNGTAVFHIPVTLPYLLSTLLLPQRLTHLAMLTPFSFPPITSQPSPHPPTTSALSVLHLRSLEALNNLLLTTAASLPTNSKLTSQVPTLEVWNGMYSIISTIGTESDALDIKGQEMRMEVLEMCLGCLWGLVKIAPERLVSSFVASSYSDDIELP